MEPERLEPEKEGPKREAAKPPLSRPGMERYGGDDEVTADLPAASSPPPPSAPRPPEVKPPQRTQPPSAPPPEKKRTAAGAGLGIAALALLLAFGYNYLNNSTPGGGGPPSASISQPAKTDLTAAETMSPNYQKHKNVNRSIPMGLSSMDRDAKTTEAAVQAAETGQPIPGVSEATPELRAKIQQKKVEFYTVRAWDTCAEDGDWVTIVTGDGAKIGTFMLTNAGKMISIPVVDGQAPTLTLIGDKDGVGGITAGIQTSNGSWYSGVLSPGESQPIPVALH